MVYVKEQLLYFDNNSVVYVHHSYRPSPSTGNFLGNPTNDVRPNKFITEFVLLDPESRVNVTSGSNTVFRVTELTTDNQAKRLFK